MSERFVPYKVQERDFFKWLKRHGYPNYNSEKRYSLYVIHDLTQDDVQEIWDAAWKAAIDRQRFGGKDCEGYNEKENTNVLSETD